MGRQRRRSEALEADLHFFGAPVVSDTPAILLSQMRELIGQDGNVDTDERSSRFLGAMYVVEGSTLGGQYIAQHVEASLDLQPGEGDRFFRGYGQETMPKWREFQQVLLTVPEAQTEEVIAAAKEMFGIFRAWMLQGSTAARPIVPTDEKLLAQELYRERADA